MCLVAVTLTWGGSGWAASAHAATSSRSGPSYAVTLPSGRRLSAETASKMVKPAIWQWMRTGSATKGAKGYDCATIAILPDGQEDGGQVFLLLRRHRYTGTVSYYLCWRPGPVPLAKLISVAVAMAICGGISIRTSGSARCASSVKWASDRTGRT